MLLHAPDRYQTKGVYFKAVKKKPMILQYVPYNLKQKKCVTGHLEIFFLSNNCTR